MSKSWTFEELQRASKWMKDHGYPSYEEFCQILKNHEAKREHYWNYLETLRRSGITNMFGAASYLMKEFGVTQKEANQILKD